MDNNKYFYLSGFLSLLFFSFFISIFIYMAFVSSEIKQYALQKDEYVSISVNFSTKKILIPTSQKNEVKKSVVKEEIVPEIVEKKLESKDIDIDDLFSDVWTKKIPKIHEKKTIKKEIKRVDNSVLKRLKKETKILKVKKSSIAKKTLSTIQTKNTRKTNSKKVNNTAQEVNKYLAKINAIIYKNFNPPRDSEGFSVVSVIILNSFGKVIDFRILRYSSNEALNKECDNLRTRLKNIIFPLNPKGGQSRTKIILTSKE